MKVAVAQIECALGDVAANVSKMVGLVVRAANNGAELVLFPEMSDTGYAMSVIREQAKAWDEGATPRLREAAEASQIAIVAGISEREGEAIYNTQVFVNSSGEVVGRYRKTHLFSPAPLEEDKCFRAGDCLVTFESAGFRFGASICYDLRFPEVYRALAVDRGVSVLLVSSAWPFPRLEHFRTLLLARAIENQCYVVAANRVGTDAGVTFCGSSAIIDPTGVVVAGGPADREELLFGEISPEVLTSTRQRMPVLKHRRPDLYRRV